MQFWHAHLDTGRDTFDAYAQSKDGALGALQKALRNHARQNDLTDGWAANYGNGGIYEDSVAVRHVFMGAAYRYGDGDKPLAYASAR